MRFVWPKYTVLYIPAIQSLVLVYSASAPWWTLAGEKVQHVEVHIKGHIDRDWSDWMSGLVITHTSRGDTVLSGMVRDQTTLDGLLDKLAGLGLQLSLLRSTDQSERNSH